jgi:hypothetical protein
MSDGAKLSGVKWLFGHFPLLLACAALALAGCGGGEESATPAATGERTATTEAGRAETATPEGRQGDGGQPGGKQGGGREAKGLRHRDASADSPKPGAKAVAPGVPVQPAGDNSIQTFGVEGAIEEREQALATLKAYLSARAAGRWTEACSVTSRQFKRQLASVAATLPKKKQPKGCAATLGYFFSWVPQTALRNSGEVNELLSFRIRDRYAYIIFRGAEDKVGYIAMRNDGGVWRINTPNPEAFPTATG